MQYAGLKHDPRCHMRDSTSGAPWFPQLFDGQLCTVYYCEKCSWYKVAQGATEVPVQRQLSSIPVNLP